MDKVIIETSARHVHLTREHVDILFGKGYQLTPKKYLSQPGQFACEEKVRVEGTKSAFPAVSVLGPERSASQVEISLTDARSIGVKAPVRESGDIKGSGSCKLVGPCGEVELEEGVIAAMRHLHATPRGRRKAGRQGRPDHFRRNQLRGQGPYLRRCRRQGVPQLRHQDAYRHRRGQLQPASRARSKAPSSFNHQENKRACRPFCPA